MMEIVHTDALIIGGGLAGLRTAIGVRRRGFDALVLSLVPAKRSHSAAAQGGMQASLANSLKGQGDNEDVHFLDTVRGSDWGADQQVVRMFVHTAPKAVRELAAWGVPWNRVRAGDRPSVIDGKAVTLTEAEGAHGLIDARNFGGTAKWRTCYVADGTGHSLLYTMSNQAIAEHIPVHERMEALSLIHDGGRCCGAVVRNLMTGQLLVYIAKAVAIATGGCGRLYRDTTNAVINEGMGAAMALETGIASLGNMEAVQFHPTAIVPSGILVTEGCRGDGGLLLDVDGHRFMPDYEPEKKELASRDVVSRWMETHIRSGKGVNTRFGDHLWLDIRLLGKTHITTRLREVNEICHYFLGIDPAQQLIPVRPAQHYSMGGVRTDHTGQSPQMQGLFAVGEAACWDMHGFNRLGGNSLAETVVGGMIVGEYMADFIESTGGDFRYSARLVQEAVAAQQTLLGSFTGAENPAQIIEEMRTVMSDKVGIFRTGDELRSAVAQLQVLQQRAARMGVKSSARGANPELVSAYRAGRMLKLALCIAMGALQREESRGAHYRADFPLRNDRDWLCRTLATWESPTQTAPTLRYESLDVQRMELPPDWRGYGAKERIENAHTAPRRAEVEAARQAALASGRSRHEVQQELMPFAGLLPESLRGANARYQEERS
jgi:fumarate reductase flavoprotein subunit